MKKYIWIALMLGIILYLLSKKRLLPVDTLPDFPPNAPGTPEWDAYWKEFEKIWR